MDHRHHGQPQPLHHLSSLPAATTAHIQHSSSHMTQVSQPQPIFISAPENRQMDLIHRRRIATPRRNFALGNVSRNWRYQEHVWTPPTTHHTHSHHAHSHHHHHHHHPGQMHQNRMHQQHPIQTGIINSGILLNFL